MAEERERQRIAAGLHDDIGQVLALAKLRLTQLSTGDEDPAVERTIRTVHGLLTQAIGSLRTLTFELSSPVLNELGLEAAIESLGQELGERHDVRFVFEALQPRTDLPHELALILFRIVRELLLNSCQHAQARCMSSRVWMSSDELCIAVHDNGVGFDHRAANQPFSRQGGFGLFNARTQLGLMSGRLELRSSPDHGTRALVRVPLPASLGRRA